MIKQDADATTGVKLLRLYQKLMLDGRRHFQTDLAVYLNCSPQTVMRLISEIESVIGSNLVTGLEKHRRWYQIRSISRNMLGLEFEELRYLAICRDLAEPYLSKQVKERVDKSIFNFSILMADQEFSVGQSLNKNQIAYCTKGWIDYTPYFGFLETLSQAMELERICLVRYKAAGAKQAKEHRFAPARILSMNNALYALGAGVSEDFKSMRHLTSLAIHRIKDVVLTDKPILFTIPHEEIGLFGLPWHEPKKFRIYFKPGRVVEYVKERVWSGKQKLYPQADNSLILELESCSQPEVEAWVRSFGDDAQLLPDDNYPCGVLGA